MLTLVLMVAMVPGVTVSAQVYSGEAGDDITWTFDAGTGVLTLTGTGAMWNWNPWDDRVPWLAHMENITGVVIADGITTIGDDAFAYASNLTNVIIPASVTHIGRGAFEGASSLISIYMPSVIFIGDWAFAGGKDSTSLTSATIRSRDVDFGSGVFYGTHPEFTIYGFAGSTAEAYAMENGHNFVPLDDDVVDTPSGWAVEQVNAAIAEGLVPLSLQQRYTQAITRAEFATLAVALYENQRGEIMGRVTFADTNDVNVQKAAYIGVVTGVGGGYFDPAAGLTREQAAVMLSRLADAIGQPLAREPATFADNAHISSWAIEQVGHVQAAGIMGGVGDNRFEPQGAYTIEQSIVTIMRLFEMLS